MKPPIPGTPQDPARLVRWGRILAILVPLILYAGSLANDFLIDDEIIITSNTRLAPGQTPREIFRRPEQFADFTLPYYRPLTNLSYWLDGRLWGRRPVGFHFTNWLLHSANTLLTFEFAWRLTRDPILGLVASFLFAAHPIHTESVDLVQGRTDLLMTLFTLLSLLALRGCVLATRTGPALAAGAASLLTLIGALLSKEIGIVWPVLAAGLAWADLEGVRERSRRCGVILAGGIAVIAGYLAVRRIVLGGVLGADLGSLTTPRVGLVPVTLAIYVRLLVWPFSFSFIRTIPAPQTWIEPRVLAAALLAAAMLAGLTALARRNRPAALGMGWALVSLLPVLNLFAIPGFIVAERYLYLPSVGFGLLVATLVRKAFLAWPVRAVQVALVTALAALLIAFAAMIQVRTAEWGDPVGVYEAMAARSPTSFFVQSNLGLQYLKWGRASDAVDALRRARDLEPDNPVAWNNLGVALAGSGRLEEARQAYERAITLRGGYAKAYENLAAVLLALRDRAGAEAASRAARELTQRTR
ncbi:MAG: tetratricopeptide repeat protein [candidate division NC10 bacterium]|nr:tetratricopeptide repeat protein [candidate division NC10 bacterium]